MYKEFDKPLKPKFGRMYVGNGARLNLGPAEENDRVTIRAGENTEFHILVEISDPEYIQGTIVGIGPNPRDDYEDWSHGDKIKVAESSITAIIRRSA